jgi:hypothetical protein
MTDCPLYCERFRRERYATWGQKLSGAIGEVYSGIFLSCKRLYYPTLTLPRGQVLHPATSTYSLVPTCQDQRDGILRGIVHRLRMARWRRRQPIGRWRGRCIRAAWNIGLDWERDWGRKSACRPSIEMNAVEMDGLRVRN